MDTKKYLYLLTLAVLTLVALYSSPTEACSCMPSHPQTDFCTADFVIIVRVLRKSHRLVANKMAYKVEIKKSYKMNPEAHRMLKHGRILTPDESSSCGVKLDIGRLYVIAGRAPYLNLCSYIKEYQKMSIVERRGFSGVYRKGCNCKILQNLPPNSVSGTGCRWSPFAKCETSFSACMPTHYQTPEGQISKCHWRRTPTYKACMADP